MGKKAKTALALTLVATTIAGGVGTEQLAGARGDLRSSPECKGLIDQDPSSVRAITHPKAKASCDERDINLAIEEVGSFVIALGGLAGLSVLLGKASKNPHESQG